MPVSFAYITSPFCLLLIGIVIGVNTWKHFRNQRHPHSGTE